jgi:hypothetical protein
VIATAPLNAGLVEQRAIAKQKTYKRGATILLREAVDVEKAKKDGQTGILPKKCVTDPKEIIVENVNGYNFQFPAGMLDPLVHLTLSRCIFPKQ